MNHRLFRLPLATLALGAGLVACADGSTNRGCSPIELSELRTSLPDTLIGANQDPDSSSDEDDSFSVLYGGDSPEKVSVLGTKYESDNEVVCPDDPDAAAERYLELVNEDINKQNAAQGRAGNEYKPFDFTAADRHFYCSAWEVEGAVSTTCVTTVHDAAVNYYLHRDSESLEAEQSRMQEIGEELADSFANLD